MPNYVLLDKSAQSFGYAAGLTTILYRRIEGGIHKQIFNVRLKTRVYGMWTWMLTLYKSYIANTILVLAWRDQVLPTVNL